MFLYMEIVNKQLSTQSAEYGTLDDEISDVQGKNFQYARFKTSSTVKTRI